MGAHGFYGYPWIPWVHMDPWVPIDSANMERVRPEVVENFKIDKLMVCSQTFLNLLVCGSSRKLPEASTDQEFIESFETCIRRNLTFMVLRDSGHVREIRNCRTDISIFGDDNFKSNDQHPIATRVWLFVNC
jgi:hypothetical protein